MTKKFVSFSDIVEENGKTIRENNLNRTHTIPLDTLVEINAPYHESHGVRLFVVHHGRDCDGTPLYTLSPKKGIRAESSDTIVDRLTKHLYGGWGEESLTPVEPPPHEKET